MRLTNYFKKDIIYLVMYGAERVANGVFRLNCPFG